MELGHYIPELAKAIVDGNKEASSLKINLKGFMVSTTHRVDLYPSADFSLKFHPRLCHPK